MRLITQTTLWYILLALLVFSVGWLATIRLIGNAVQQETDYELARGLNRVKKALENGVPYERFNRGRLSVRKLPEVYPEGNVRDYYDTLVVHDYTKKLENFRKVSAITTIGEESFKIELFDIFFEGDDIEEIVSKIMVRLFIVLSLVLMVGNWFISSWAFRPFNLMLRRIDQFNLKKAGAFPATPTRIYEFKRLNWFLDRMASKAKQDYQSLKEFSENASHEMQTPIAIAQGKLELLMEMENLEEQELALIQGARDSMIKLSKLGKALALITKIENQEFSAEQEIDFSVTVNKVVEDMRELGRLKNIEIESKINEEVQLRIDPILGDVLVTNLLKNALQHNLENGWVKVEMDNEKLVVTNTGPPPTVPTELLFQRFKKNNQAKGSLGLGLAIVKRICELNMLAVSYEYFEESHEVKIYFP